MVLTKTLILPSTYPTTLSPSDAKHPAHRLRRRLTLALHVISAVSSLVGIAVFAAAIPLWNANFFHATGPNRGDWTDGLALAPLSIAAVYHGGTLTHKFIVHRSSSPRIHSPSKPAIYTHALIPLLILSFLPPALLLAGWGSLFRFWAAPIRNQSGLLQCNQLNLFTRECSPVLYTVGALQISGIVFGCLLWCCEFVLAMVGWRAWRRMRLVERLQREKIERYAREGDRKPKEAGRSRGSGDGMARTRSHGSRRGDGSRKGSTDSAPSRRSNHPDRDSRDSRSSRGSTKHPNHSHSRSATGPSPTDPDRADLRQPSHLPSGAGNSPSGSDSLGETRSSAFSIPIYLEQPPPSHAPTDNRFGPITR